ncbi:MAG: AsmA-like C-terminal region-containing protein, partial [Planctomycetes bacterium]|nr:AsmA-like C-terminal region-containing protein [Planctomycetota bacterium]
LSGVLRAAARIRMDNGRIETSAQAEIDNAGLGLTIDPVGAQVEIPKTSIALSAGTHLTSPLEINLASLSIDTGGAAFRINESDGWGIAGRLGEMLLRAAGTIDLQAGQSEFSNLGINLNGLAVNLGQNNQQVAGLSSGVMRLIVAAPDHKVSLPLSSQGDFNLPALEAGADGLVFHRFTDGRSEDSDFGSLRAKLGIDGYIGEEKRQLINIRTASLSAKPLAVNSRGQFDLGNYAVVFEYAARLIPAGMASFLWFLDFPPSLLENADVSGVLNYDGQQATTRGAVQGNLRLASDQLNHFEMTHDISAAYQQNDKTLAVNVRRLDGNVKTGSGESVVLLAAQPSNLLLSPTDAKGILDIRLNGAAAPTRILAVGLAGVLPQLREYAKVLYQAQAEGVYTAWLQVQEKDSSGISLKAGGVWEGAALHVDGVPYLSEAQKLSAALEGDWSLRDNRINLSRLFFRTDSGQIQADGAASMTLSTNGSGNVNGISDVNINLRFVMADLARTALTFPGLIPADFGLTGRIDGSFQAGGGSDDIRVSEGRMRFQGFQAKPGGFDVAIPSGTATFDAAVALALNAPINQPSPYDALKLFNIRNGQAALTGAQFKGQNVNTLSGSFQLQNGLLTLLSGNMEVDDGGAAAINGTVDFNRPAPAVNLSLMAHNIQLANANPTLHEYMEFQSGSVNLPAAQGQAAGVSFQGFSEDEILHSLRLENFTFTTGPVTIHTGPVLNEELDRATSRLMKQEMGGTGQARLITLNSVSGVVQAAGNGVITIPADNPIQINGNNTGDFRVQGVISADQTLNLDFFIVGKLENLFGTTMPSIIPSFRSGGEEERSRFMTRMNQNAAAGHYRVNISGPWGQPNLAGIGLLAGRFIADMAMAVPGQIVGGVVSTPGNIVRGIGSLLGAGGSQASEHPEADQPDLSPLPTTPQAEPAERERGGFRLPFIR